MQNNPTMLLLLICFITVFFFWPLSCIKNSWNATMVLVKKIRKIFILKFNSLNEFQSNQKSMCAKCIAQKNQISNQVNKIKQFFEIDFDKCDALPYYLGCRTFLKYFGKINFPTSFHASASRKEKQFRFRRTTHRFSRVLPPATRVSPARFDPSFQWHEPFPTSGKGYPVNRNWWRRFVIVLLNRETQQRVHSFRPFAIPHKSHDFFIIIFILKLRFILTRHFSTIDLPLFSYTYVWY